MWGERCLVSQTLSALIDDLERQETFRLLEPWRYSSKSLALVVPIVRVRYGSREYIVLDEFPGILSIRDAGRVGKVIVENGSDKHVFIRGGCILEGLTQPRALRYGILVEPGATYTVDVVCVHATSPIRRGKELRPALYVPFMLKHVISRGSQNEVWDSIGRYALAYLNRYVPDLTEVVRSIEKAQTKIADVIEKFPLVKDQVGVIIVGTKGVEALELFDHPKSWSAIAKNAGKEFGEILAEEQEIPIFKPDSEAIKEAINFFLGKIKECRETEVFKGKNTYTKLLEGNGIVGEYTVLNNNTIHLMVARTEKPFKKREKRISPYARLSEIREIERYRELLSSILSEMKTTEPRRRIYAPMMLMHLTLTRDRRVEKTLFKVLKALREKQLTWTELVEKLSREVSPATISRRLKNGINQGLITKTLRENGKPAYTLTAKGTALLEKLEKKR